MKHDRDIELAGTAELKKIHRTELKENFSKLTSKQAKSVMKIVQFDAMKETMQNLKNLKNTTPTAWRNNLNKLMAINKVRIPLDSGEFDIYSLLDKLIPLLAAFAGATLAFKCNEGKTFDAAEPILEDCKREMYDLTNMNADKNLVKNNAKSVANNKINEPNAVADTDDDYDVPTAVDNGIKDSRVYTTCQNPTIPLMFYPVTQEEWERMKTDSSVDYTFDDRQLPYYICPCEFLLRFKEYKLRDWDFSDNPVNVSLYNSCYHAAALYNNAQRYDCSNGDLDSSLYKLYCDSSCPYIESHPNTFGNKKKDEKKKIAFENCPCSVSMCDSSVVTDLDQLLANNVLAPAEARYVIVEYDRNHNHFVDVSVGQVIDVMDDIGTIEDLPVKSRLNIKIIYKDDHLFVGYYITDKYTETNDSSTGTVGSEFDVNKIMAKFDNSKLEEINELYKQDSYIVRFIKDYIMYFRFPELALHTQINNGTGNAISYEDYEEKYREISDSITDSFNNQIKNVSSKDYIEPKAKAGKILDLKDEINDMKNDNLKTIIDHYYGYNKIGYCSLGRIKDFLLYDYYMDYLTGDYFYYDDQNPYVVKLFDRLSTYIGKRFKIEKGNDNVSALISKFNSLCSSTVSAYFSPKNGNYYEEIKRKFGYIYYTDSETELIAAKVDDVDRVTLYSKVYDFLKTVCKYTTPETKSIEYSDDMDPTAILNANVQDNTDRTFDNKLRKVALNFVMLRIMETSVTDKSFLSEYNGVTNPLNSGGEMLGEYYENYSGLNLLIYTQRKRLDEYLKTLQKMTRSEVSELDLIGKDALNWYYEHDSDIMSGKVFDIFKEIVWSTPSKVYWYTTPFDFYYLQYRLEDMEHADLDKVYELMADNSQSPATGDGDTDKVKPKMPTDPGYDIDTDTTNNYVNSGFGPNKYPYWLVYMCWATLVNCMIPLYWSTGLIIMGAPIPLPIIFIPIYALPGRVTTVFGIGLCGICPLPMILFVNMSNTPGTIIFPINIVIDVIQMCLGAVLNAQTLIMALKIKPIAASFDAKINSTEQQIKDTEEKIQQMKSMIKVERKTLRAMKRRDKENPMTTSLEKEKSD